MPQKTSLDEVRQVEKLGVKFELNSEIAVMTNPPALAGEQKISLVKVGVNADSSDLLTKHDAVFLAVGLGETNKLNIEGENLDGVMDALAFIERIKTRDWQTVPLGRIVAVIGAGNTAIDAVTQAKRLGAERVFMIYRRTEKDISAYAYEYELAKKDGVEFMWETAPVAIGGDSRVANLRLQKDGLEFEINCDLVIKAIGQQKQVGFFTAMGIKFDEKQRVAVNENMQTSNPRIFAGGDCVNGGAEAVDASQMGKLAAQGIHFSLTGEKVEFAGAKVPAIVKSHAH
jgi:dihydropyrimidine dehydrogenase (NAD+) subunit PreT